MFASKLTQNHASYCTISFRSQVIRNNSDTGSTGIPGFFDWSSSAENQDRPPMSGRILYIDDVKMYHFVPSILVQQVFSTKVRKGRVIDEKDYNCRGGIGVVRFNEGGG